MKVMKTRDIYYCVLKIVPSFVVVKSREEQF